MKGALANQECKKPCMAVDSRLMQKYTFLLLYTDRELEREKERERKKGRERASYNRWTSRNYKNYNRRSIHVSHIPLFLFVCTHSSHASAC